MGLTLMLMPVIPLVCWNKPCGAVVGAGSSMSMSIMPGVTGTSLWPIVEVLATFGVKPRLAPGLDCTALMAAMRTSGARLACSSS